MYLKKQMGAKFVVDLLLLKNREEKHVLYLYFEFVYAGGPCVTLAQSYITMQLHRIYTPSVAFESCCVQ